MSALSNGHVEIRSLSVIFGRNGAAVEAVKSFDLAARPGEFVSILGSSGCGKSTVLNTVAGFVRPTQGQVLVDGEPVTGPGADRGMVFQQHSLFPWKTVVDNVAFGLKMRGVGRSQRESAARTFLHLVGLGGFEKAYPVQLSGGMQQRVGIARVLVNNPRVMLMDEPFAALDAQSRMMMQEMLLQIWQEVRTTVLFVTHDVDEAIFLSDRVSIMTARPGTLKRELAVPLPRPRTPEMATEETFVRLKREALALIREESLKTLGGWKSGSVLSHLRREVAAR